jgi:hypothetical protein
MQTLEQYQSELGKSNKWRGTRKAGTRIGGGSEWVREHLHFEADATQAEVLNGNYRRLLLNCTRQWGKSTVAAAKAVYQAHAKPGSLTLVVSPSSRQSGEVLRKVEEFVKRMGVPPRSDGDNRMSMLFPNGSRIVGLPGTEATVRGFSAVSLLVVDEAARVSDELYLAIRPMLAVSRGTLWLMSTPFGRRGFFYEAWEHGGDEWERVRVTAQDCSRIPRGFLTRERRATGDRAYRQEYLCDFLHADHDVFDGELVYGAITGAVKPLRLE